MEFRILGPLDVVESGTPVPIGGHKQRALLAALILRRGEVLTVDRLIDELWGEHPPATAAKSIQVHVSQLRKALGADRVETRGRGYALHVDLDEIDAVRFERALERGRGLLARGEADAAAEALRSALDLWRGEPLADLAYEPFLQEEVRRLDELRLTALEERLEADLARGQAHKLVTELTALASRHPLRERLRGQLMLALYRSGRQADALEVFAATRHALVEELGIEPGPELRELHAGILAHDPALAGPARRRAPRRRRRPRALTAGLAAAALLAAMVAVAVLAHHDVAQAVHSLPDSFCSPIHFEGSDPPDLLIAADQALGGAEVSLGSEITLAVETVLRAHHYRTGRFSVAYQACDTSGGADAGFAGTACATSATEFARNSSLVAVVGPTESSCAQIQLPITSRAGLAMVSPSTTRVGLTRAGPGTQPEEPDRYYPTGVRNYVRVLPADDFQAAGAALLTTRLGVSRVFVLAGPGAGAVADAYAAAASRLEVRIAGREDWEVPADGYVELADRVARSRADGVYVAGSLSGGGGTLVGDLRVALDDRVPIVASDGFAVESLLDVDGPSTGGPARTDGMYVTLGGVVPDALPASARADVSRLQAELGRPPGQFAVYALQATEMLLAAIARSDGGRESVRRELFETSVQAGIIGDFRVTESGDITANQVTVFRVHDGRLRFDRVLTPPLSLVVAR